MELSSKFIGEIKTDEPLSLYTSFEVGGPVDYLIIPHSEADIVEVLREFPDIRVIGAGSNLLISDKGLTGGVILMSSNIREIEIYGNLISVGAGCKLNLLVSASAALALSGLEWASGIPGTVGGAVMTNAGAYGGSIWRYIESVHVIEKSGDIKEVTIKDIKIGYRKVEFGLEKPFVIINVTFQLERDSEAYITALIEDLNGRRKAKQPLEYPSAGSVFKNPGGGHSAGRLIEQAGLKGTRCGGAMISNKHANFIVNVDRACANDIYTLIKYAKKTVFEVFDIEIETEIEMIGEFNCREDDIVKPK